MSVTEVFDKLATSAYNNRLVLFLGTGFSKAVMGYDAHAPNHCNDAMSSVVPGWMELLSRCRKELKLEDKAYGSIKASIDCPAEASEIVGELAKKGGLTLEAAEKKLKETVGDLSDWHPNPEQVCKFQDLFAKIRPALIITTNYDDVIETVLHKGYSSIGPSDVLCRLPEGMTPVYHVHGTRRDPEHMVITREDYVRALHPMTYRQSKLACIMRENTVVYLGYSRNDINVLAALDIANSSFQDVPQMLGDEGPYQVQVVHEEAGSVVQDSGNRSQIMIPFLDTCKFFEDLASARDEYSSKARADEDEVRKLYDDMLGINGDTAKNALENKRDQLRKLVEAVTSRIREDKAMSSWWYGMVIVIAQRLFDFARSEAYRPNNFKAYEDCVIVLVEVLANVDKFGVRSFLFDFAAEKLEELSPYLGNESGQSRAAYDTLRRSWQRVPDIARKQLRAVAVRHESQRLLSLLKMLEEVAA